MPVSPTHHFNTGNPNLDNQLRKLARAVRTAQPRGMGSLRIRSTPTGTIHSVSQSRRRYPVTGRGGTIAVSAPFTCSIVSDLSDPEAKLYWVQILPGVVNGALPKNQYDSNALNLFDLNDGVNYVKLSIASDDGQQATGVTYSVDDSALDPIETTMGACPTSFEWLLAVVAGTHDDGFTLWQISTGNVIAVPRQVFVSAKEAPQYGLEPFDRWWTWLVYQGVGL